MADWSQLPKELLLLITKHLETRFDVTHFRSVCSSWRSSVPPKPCLLPASFQITPFNGNSITSFCLSKRIIVLIRLPENHNQAATDHWLVKIEENGRKGMHLLNPLWKYSLINGSKVLDFMNCQVIELSREYVVHYNAYHDHSLQPSFRDYTENVAFMWTSTEKNDYVLLAVDRGWSLAMFRSRDKQWTKLGNMAQIFVDIISFNGKFYALDENGNTMVVEPSSNVSFLAHVGARAQKTFLVESFGQLLLVEKFSLATRGRNMGFGTRSSIQQGWRSPMMMVWFKVHKLNEAGQKWDHVKSLGDRVLFFGTHGAFSASASEFSCCKGDYIIFGSNNFDHNGEEDMFVFDYENDSVESLKNCPSFSKLFWPPPDWVTSTTQ